MHETQQTLALDTANKNEVYTPSTDSESEPTGEGTARKLIPQGTTKKLIPQGTTKKKMIPQGITKKMKTQGTIKN